LFSAYFIIDIDDFFSNNSRGGGNGGKPGFFQKFRGKVVPRPLWKNHGLFHSFSRDFFQKHFSTFFSQGFPRGNVEKFLGELGLGLWEENLKNGTFSPEMI
jgi:hypothetical protein